MTINFPDRKSQNAEQEDAGRSGHRAWLQWWSLRCGADRENPEPAWNVEGGRQRGPREVERERGERERERENQKQNIELTNTQSTLSTTPTGGARRLFTRSTPAASLTPTVTVSETSSASPTRSPTLSNSVSTLSGCLPSTPRRSRMVVVSVYCYGWVVGSFSDVHGKRVLPHSPRNDHPNVPVALSLTVHRRCCQFP
jgi:hypothetical protein